MQQRFLCNFTCEEDVFNAFKVDSTKIDEGDGRILFAWYGDGSYSGAAFVLLQEGGKLYEVNASHCSCYGLEDQWEPEETSVEALRFRMTEGTLGSGNFYDGEDFAGALEECLKEYENEK